MAAFMILFFSDLDFSGIRKEVHRHLMR